MKYDLQNYDYEMPQELIASSPSDRRDESKLMVVHKNGLSREHRIFKDIVEYLHPGDLLVRNSSRVIPARIFGRKRTGARIEMLLLKQLDADRWEALCRPAKRLKDGDIVDFDFHVSGLINRDLGEGKKDVTFKYDGDWFSILEQIGATPIPPYIDIASSDLGDLEIRARYQTVYADRPGSVAAPTAGLHFTSELFEDLISRGIEVVDVDLQVGLGTFRSITVDDVRDHVMHSERYYVAQENLFKIQSAKANRRRIVAVGTTSVRVLESISECLDGKHKGAISGETSIFIYPGYRFKVVDALITNFHLPKSSLLLLISAFLDRDSIMNAYAEAVMRKYRFYSFGDAMFIV